jgi:hypothetical protein
MRIFKYTPHFKKSVSIDGFSKNICHDSLKNVSIRQLKYADMPLVMC